MLVAIAAPAGATHSVTEWQQASARAAGSQQVHETPGTPAEQATLSWSRDDRSTAAD